MNINNELVEFLEKRFDERYDERYVKHNDCNSVQMQHARSFAEDDKRIELIKSEFAAIKKFGWVIATTTIGLLVTAIFDLIKGAI